jgi:hypothetical protein
VCVGCVCVVCVLCLGGRSWPREGDRPSVALSCFAAVDVLPAHGRVGEFAAAADSPASATARKWDDCARPAQQGLGARAGGLLASWAGQALPTGIFLPGLSHSYPCWGCGPGYHLGLVIGRPPARGRRWLRVCPAWKTLDLRFVFSHIHLSFLLWCCYHYHDALTLVLASGSATGRPKESRFFESARRRTWETKATTRTLVSPSSRTKVRW